MSFGVESKYVQQTENKPWLGHLVATITITFWGLTFVSTKVLLEDFEPIEILFCRFLLGLIALSALRPKLLKLKERKHELLFIAAGLTGVTGYFFFENTALTTTTATNASIITTTAPMFGAIFGQLVYRNGGLRARFIIGFVLAMAGIVIISSGGNITSLSFGSIGDLLALAAAAIWAVYSLITAKIQRLGYETLHTTKRVFAWGLVFMIPLLPLMGAHLDFTRFANPINVGNLCFLGLGASALCFVLWGTALKHIGTNGSLVYIYAQPVITVIASIIILHEALTPAICIGIVLVLVGLILSQTKNDKTGSED